MATKKITDLQLRGDVDADVNFPGDDTIQTYRVTAQQIADFVLPDSGLLPRKLNPAVVQVPTNYSLAASVGSNALTIALKAYSGADASSTNPILIPFRSVTLTTGTPVIRTVTGALSLVISSGSTLGSVSAFENYIYVYAIDNAGTVELAVSGLKLFDESGVVSTTAEGGAGAADSISTLYSTTARSNVPCRLIGRIKSTQATAGTWATAPSEISNIRDTNSKNFAEFHYSEAAGFGSSNTKIRYFTNLQVSSDPGSIATVSNSSTNGFSVTANKRCKVTMNYTDSYNSASTPVGISLNSSQLSTDLSSITAADRKAISQTATANLSTQVSWSGILTVGSTVRPHSSGDAVGTGKCQITVFVEEI